MTKLKGQCMCGVVSYEITGPIGPIVNCHCLNCRRWHNAAFRTRAAVKRESFHWLTGESHIKQCHSSENVIKTFCKQCGSNLISLLCNDPDTYGVPIGALENADDLKPSMHIFVKYKAPWFEIKDDLPQYEEWPPEGRLAIGDSNQ